MVIVSMINKQHIINVTVKKFISVIPLFIYISKINIPNVSWTTGKSRLLNSRNTWVMKDIKFLKCKSKIMKRKKFNKIIIFKILSNRIPSPTTLFLTIILFHFQLLQTLWCHLSIQNHILCKIHCHKTCLWMNKSLIFFYLNQKKEKLQNKQSLPTKKV